MGLVGNHPTRSLDFPLETRARAGTKPGPTKVLPCFLQGRSWEFSAAFELDRDILQWDTLLDYGMESGRERSLLHCYSVHFRRAIAMAGRPTVQTLVNVRRGAILF